MTGLDLKITRIRSRVKQTDLAVEMGISRPRVSIIEAKEKVSEEMIVRYVRAVERVSKS